MPEPTRDTTASDTKRREQRDRDVARAQASAGDELAAAAAKRNPRADRKARAERDEQVSEAQRAEAAAHGVIRRHTFTTDDGDELEGKAAVKAQQKAVIDAMDAENDARYAALGIKGKPAHYRDGTP